MKTALSLILCVICGASPAPGRTPKDKIPARDAAPPGKTYVYKTSAGEEREMEIYFPKRHNPRRAKVPGMILFHGGAWLGGSLSEFRAACAYFASRGLVCATAEYQMLDITKEEAAKLPAGQTHKQVCVTDAKSAIRWFKQNADKLGIDPDQIITGGTSAGGHISALATMSPGSDDPADPKDIDTSVVAYIWINPAFSLGDQRAPDIDVMRHMKADIPPTIVFFGDQDGWKKGWDTALRKWKSLGAENIEVQIAQGEGHGFVSNNIDWETITYIEIDRFLVKHGFITGEPTLAMPDDEKKFVEDTGDPE